MPKLTIDGQETEVAQGTTVLEAALSLGIEIPHFCYHKDLRVAASCRLCLVEVQGWPKLAPSCHLKASDGMVIHTASPQVLEARRSTMEFLLINHPVDCPICDQVGECHLQDYYFQHDTQPKRYHEPKLAADKMVPFGEKIIYDGERCILCTRCVRFFEDVMGESLLAVIKRGSWSHIGPALGQDLDHPYSLNIVDLCPVGALTSRDFRFQGRVPFLKKAPSVCPGCATGCNISLQAYHDRVVRYRARPNDQVNRSFLCDDGRMTYRMVNEGRLLAPLIKGQEAGTLAEALGEAARALKSVKGAALALSATLTNEDAFMAVRLAGDLLETKRAYLGGRAPWKGDKYLKSDDRNPNRAGVTLVLSGLVKGEIPPVAQLITDIEKGQIKAILMVAGPCLAEGSEVEALAKALAQVEASVIMASHVGPLTRAAKVALPMATFAEGDGTFTNKLGLTQRLRPALAPLGASLAGWDMLGQLASALGLSLMEASARKVHETLLERVDLPQAAEAWGSDRPCPPPGLPL